MHLSTNQQKVVEWLYKNPKLHLSSTQLAHLLNKPYDPNIVWTPSQVHSILSRLEKRGIVWRNKSIPGYWRLTLSATRAYERSSYYDSSSD